jgi:RNA polymerase sigma-70 factor (ECF subfamily)
MLNDNASTPQPAPELLAQHRGYLLQFARRRLRDAALAEDLVQDVLLAAVAGQARFEQRSSLRTWLVAILKHKIVDARRSRSTAISLESMLDDSNGVPPVALVQEADPCLHAQHRQRLARVQARLEALPGPLRRAFELHVLLGHTTQEVCDALAISQGNLWVRVHRVRRGLAAA